MGFKNELQSIKAMARSGGNAAQRIAHYFTNTLVRRLNGTAYKFFRAPLRRSKEVRLNALSGASKCRRFSMPSASSELEVDAATPCPSCHLS